jgi:SOS response associated peptidase (SRAP)
VCHAPGARGTENAAPPIGRANVAVANRDGARNPLSLASAATYFTPAPGSGSIPGVDQPTVPHEGRCLIPANCYYESHAGPTASGWTMRHRFFIGGIWDVWHAREPEALFTFTLLTTLPNEVSATVHDRMPLIVQPNEHARWLDRERRGRGHPGAVSGRGDDRVSGQPAGE